MTRSTRGNKTKFDSLLQLLALVFALLAVCPAGSAFGKIYYFQLASLRNGLQVSDLTDYQWKDAWCWAACVEMSFKLQGVLVPQDTVVKLIKGSMANFGGTPDEVSKALDSLNWQGKDQKALPFASVGLLNNHLISPILIAVRLIQGAPTIAFLGNGITMGHVILICGIAINDQNGNEVLFKTYDPWPKDEAGQMITHDHAVVRLWSGIALFNATRFTICPAVISQANSWRRGISLAEDAALFPALSNNTAKSLLPLIGTANNPSIKFDTLNDLLNWFQMPMPNPPDPYTSPQ
jgi:hypothetical protein